jgi:hypothetical protein
MFINGTSMNNIETMKLALEAHKKNESHRTVAETRYWCEQYKLLAEQAIEQAQQAEPVAWVSTEELLIMKGNALAGAKDWRINVGLVKQDGDVGLYTSPTPRQPLTIEKIDALYESTESVNWGRSFARAIEAAHGIKGGA